MYLDPEADLFRGVLLDHVAQPQSGSQLLPALQGLGQPEDAPYCGACVVDAARCRTRRLAGSVSHHLPMSNTFQRLPTKGLKYNTRGKSLG